MKLDEEGLHYLNILKETKELTQKFVKSKGKIGAGAENPTFDKKARQFEKFFIDTMEVFFALGRSVGEVVTPADEAKFAKEEEHYYKQFRKALEMFKGQ